jgi:hypothetical protein
MASANTRAGGSTANYSSSSSLPGLGRSASGEGQEEGDGGGLLLAAVAGGLIIGGIYFASDEDNCASPGAC